MVGNYRLWLWEPRQKLRTSRRVVGGLTHASKLKCGGFKMDMAAGDVQITGWGQREGGGRWGRRSSRRRRLINVDSPIR